MKLVLVGLVVGLCALAGSSDMPIAERQTHVVLLLTHINQPLKYGDRYSSWTKIVESWNVSQHSSDYSEPKAVEQFELYELYGWMPKGEIFSVMYQSQLKQAIVLFELLYYAKSYEVFFNTSAWARHRFNEGMFLYAFSLAVVHRPDMQDVILPPIYEIYPYYFYNVQVIQQAYKLKQTNDPRLYSTYDQHYILWINSSDNYLNLHPEQSMSYYLEDVGINAFYYYFNLYYPFWMSSKEYGWTSIKRGEQYFFLYQQLTAKYYLERISNGFGDIPWFNWDVPIETPYYPSLEYPNGLEFPNRPPFAKLHEYFYNYGQSWTWMSEYGYSYTLVQDWERRIKDAIDSGVVFVGNKIVKLDDIPDALNFIGYIIEGSPESPNNEFYGQIWLYARHLLGYSYQPLNAYQIAPSALEHFETSLRDPIFYQLYKKILLLFYKYLYKLPSYTIHDLVFPGVDITNVKFDKLVTYNENFYSEISHAVYDTYIEIFEDSFHIQAVQSRLNHKPFNYQIALNSDNDTKSVVKVFMAPFNDKYNRHLNLSQNFMNMVLLDYFVYDLKSGENVISRNSYDSHLYEKDPLSYQELLKRMFTVEDGKGSWSTERYYRYFPDRYMLPRGSPDGTPFQIYIAVYPYVPQTTNASSNGVYEPFFYPFVEDKQFIDSYPLLYPFDKPIYHDNIWHKIPNIYSYKTEVFHEKDVNVAH